MRNNTPPSSPFFERDDMIPDDQDDDGEDDELIYVGDGEKMFLECFIFAIRCEQT